MISQSRPKRICLCCEAPATRWAVDREDSAGRRRRIYLCDRCPSPSQIDQAARAIAWGWTNTERGTRYYCCPSNQVADKNRAELPVCTIGCADGRTARPATGD